MKEQTSALNNIENFNDITQKTDQLEMLDLNTVFENARRNPQDNTAKLAKENAITLLTKIHGGMYSKTFPIPEEQEDLGD
ncbi:MAG: hypothetical protein H6908_03910 [Hyphomicrobiales bacterium]|nr:hypothetical protein [Rickettsiales bacterium]MCP5361769.1 hypothetical protein [Hyphomicrobiales bacterium]